jgi:hypothetical protein
LFRKPHKYLWEPLFRKEKIFKVNDSKPTHFLVTIGGQIEVDANEEEFFVIL